jgi:hypothetical protein
MAPPPAAGQPPPRRRCRDHRDGHTSVQRGFHLRQCTVARRGRRLRPHHGDDRVQPVALVPLQALVPAAPPAAADGVLGDGRWRGADVARERRVRRHAVLAQPDRPQTFVWLIDPHSRRLRLTGESCLRSGHADSSDALCTPSNRTPRFVLAGPRNDLEGATCFEGAVLDLAPESILPLKQSRKA